MGHLQVADRRAWSQRRPVRALASRVLPPHAACMKHGSDPATVLGRRLGSARLALPEKAREDAAMQSRDLPTRGARREEGEGVSRLPWLQPRCLAGEHKLRPEGMTQ